MQLLLGGDYLWGGSLESIAEQVATHIETHHPLKLEEELIRDGVRPDLVPGEIEAAIKSIQEAS